MYLEIGKTYVTPQGENVTITHKTDMFCKGHNMHLPYVGSNGKRYTEQGEAQWIFPDAGDTLREKPVASPLTMGQAVGCLIDKFLSR